MLKMKKSGRQCIKHTVHICHVLPRHCRIFEFKQLLDYSKNSNCNPMMLHGSVGYIGVCPLNISQSCKFSAKIIGRMPTYVRNTKCLILILNSLCVFYIFKNCSKHQLYIYIYIHTSITSPTRFGLTLGHPQ